MKRLWLVGMLFTATCSGQIPDRFFVALHQVETGGRLGAVKGDGGRALGPLQIHRGYWQDSGVAGRYEDCAGLEYSRAVVTAYMRRYARQAVASGDLETLARCHNGGPSGHRKTATLGYWQKVKANL